MGTACHIRGAGVILESWERRLNIKVGKTTPDREFSLEQFGQRTREAPGLAKRKMEDHAAVTSPRRRRPTSYSGNPVPDTDTSRACTGYA